MCARTNHPCGTSRSQHQTPIIIIIHNNNTRAIKRPRPQQQPSRRQHRHIHQRASHHNINSNNNIIINHRHLVKRHIIHHRRVSRKNRTPTRTTISRTWTRATRPTTRRSRASRYRCGPKSQTCRSELVCRIATWSISPRCSVPRRTPKSISRVSSRSNDPSSTNARVRPTGPLRLSGRLASMATSRFGFFTTNILCFSFYFLILY